jgi:hypothetical protein
MKINFKSLLASLKTQLLILRRGRLNRDKDGKITHAGRGRR